MATTGDTTSQSMKLDPKDYSMIFRTLCTRATEPVFIPKTENGITFDVPEDLLAPRFKPIINELSNRFSGAKEHIPVMAASIPDMTEIEELSRYDNFSLWIPSHRRYAGLLIKIFMGMKTVEDLLAAAVYARDRVNPYLFNYALSVALLHRPDTENVSLDSFVSFFPDKFIDSRSLGRARRTSEVIPEGSRDPIVIPRDYSATDFEPEHRLAYFREDIGVNLHHWHWHLVYPFTGPKQVVDKDRRGELFYYMHSQLITRYNVERLCNKLPRVERLVDFRKPIPEGYFPKLDSIVASRGWPGRVSYSSLQNINRSVDKIRFDIDDMERWRDRIYAAIHSGAVVLPDGSRKVLDEFSGIDILGNIIDASDLSPNRNFYGDLHNTGHIFLAYIHDPDNRHLETFGVMGDVATAMRDPVFYRWHAFIDDIFQEFKDTLPAYPVAQLEYKDIIMKNVQVNVVGGKPNILETFWQQSDVELSRGMDFTPRGPVYTRFTHLQHTDFVYNIQVMNQGNPRKGTCRIFLGPKFDERGLPMLFREQKLLMIEMDRFTVQLKKGLNTINRRSNQSSVTIPFERTYRDLDTNRAAAGTDALAQFNFCGCGWPDNMLLPKGTLEGYPMQLFVMISNYENDIIQQSTDGACNDAHSFCGLKDKKYPDKRSMGYPFDRVPRDGVDTLDQFLLPNMKVQDVTIMHSDRTVVRTQEK